MQTGLKDKIASGKPSIGASIAMASPDLVDFCGFLGFEWIMMDAESGPIHPSDCLAICRVCEAHGMVPIVKVPRPDPGVIQAYLCTGAGGLWCPMSTRQKLRKGSSMRHVTPRKDGAVTIWAAGLPVMHRLQSMLNTLPGQIGSYWWAF